MPADKENKYNNTDRECNWRVVVRRFTYHADTQTYILYTTKKKAYPDYDTARRACTNARELHACEVEIYHRRALLEQFPLNARWQ